MIFCFQYSLRFSGRRINSPVICSAQTVVNFIFIKQFIFIRFAVVGVSFPNFFELLDSLQV